MKFTYPPDAKPVDGYTIRRGLHRGGFGEVYYAVSHAGKEVALKLLTHDLETELRGIRQCLNLKHPNLVTIFDVKTDAEGDTWVVMEYVSGASLEDVLNAFPNGLPIEEVRDWMAGIVAGTEYLHSRGIVHRDLKPANIYRENGCVKIGDVGLSKQMGGTRRQHTEAVGTVYYMAPEVARGQYGVEVDVYSLGVMLYEMLTGKLPFDGETTAEILMKHLSAQPDLSIVPVQFRDVIRRSLAKDPADRIRTVRQLGEELQRVLKFEPLPESAFESTSQQTNGAHAHRSTNGHQPWSKRWGCDPFQHWQDICGSGKVSPATFACDYVSQTVERVQQHVQRQIDRAAEKEQRRRERRKQQAEAAALRAAQARSRPSTQSRSQWYLFAAVVLVLFVPWHKLSQSDAWEVLGLIVFWGGLLVGFDYLTRPKTIPQSDALPAAVTTPQRTRPPISLSEALAWSTLQAMLASALLLGAGWVSWSQFTPGLGAITPNDLVWLIGSGVLGAVAVVTVFVSTQRYDTRGRTMPQWLSFGWKMLLVGTAVGLLVGLLADFLEVRDTLLGPARPLFRSIGVHPLVTEGHPTLMAYVVFFAGALWLQSWEQVLHRERRYRLRLGPVAWAAVFGGVGASLCGLPVPYGVLWMMTINASAQIAAPWEPRLAA